MKDFLYYNSFTLILGLIVIQGWANVLTRESSIMWERVLVIAVTVSSIFITLSAFKGYQNRNE